MKMPTFKDLVGTGYSDVTLFSSITRRRYFYQHQAGQSEIRDTLSHYETQRSGVEHSPKNIMVVSGSLRGFSLTVDTLFPKGVTFFEIVPTYPLLSGYLHYVTSRRNIYHTKKIYPNDRTNYIVTLDEVLPHVAENSVFVLTNPNNPTGLYFRFMEKFVATCVEKNAYVIIDEANDIPHNSGAYASQKLGNIHDNVIRIRSFSKTNFFAGFRLGYIVSGEKTISVLANRYAFSDGNAPVVLNDVIAELYKNSSEWESELSRTVREKVEFAIACLSNHSEIEHIIMPEASYYLFLKIRKPISSWQLFLLLLEQGVNVVPGILFGIDNNAPWIRICCAREYDYLKEALAALVSTISSLKI